MSSYRHCIIARMDFIHFKMINAPNGTRFFFIPFQFYSDVVICCGVWNPFLKQMIFRFLYSFISWTLGIRWCTFLCCVRVSTFFLSDLWNRMDFDLKWMLIDFNCDDEWWNNYNYHYYSFDHIFFSQNNFVFIGFHSIYLMILDVWKCFRTGFFPLIFQSKYLIDLFRQIRQVSKHISFEKVSMKREWKIQT